MTSTETSATKLRTLVHILRNLSQVAVAVRGGIDSMTLAAVAHRTLGPASTMFHAISPAVPEEVTERVRRYAAREGWRLRIMEAGEFEDRQHINHPVDHCNYCEFSLHWAIRQHSERVIVCGATLDDLGNHRPGLRGADDHGVRHPLAEAGIDQVTVRRIARQLGLNELAELPATACLSSRVETGIRPDMLTLIHRVERYILQQLQPQAVRCRVRRTGIVIELDQESLTTLSIKAQRRLAEAIEQLCRQAGFEQPLGFESYRTGSAFLRGGVDA
jgi:uncharacterized protein